MTVCELVNLVDDTLGFYDEGEWSEIPVTVSYYNREVELDRVVIQMRGKKGVTLHYADVGVGK